MALDRKFVLTLTSTQLQVAGQLLEANDSDNTGTDDVVGKVTVSLGKAISSFASGDITKVNEYLKVIADAIYDYLGLVSPTKGEQ